MFGSMLNSIGGSLLGRAGVAGESFRCALPVGSYLDDELLKMLDCKEQEQAAKATDQAIRGGVGTEVAGRAKAGPMSPANRQSPARRSSPMAASA